MKKSLLMPTFPLKMNLQFFAEGGSEEGGQGGTSTNPAGQGTDEPDGEEEDGKEGNKTFSRDDVAKMISAETTKAVNRAKEQWEAELKNEQSEADKLAEMNEKEKAEYEKQKLIDKIAELEQEQNQSKMSKSATVMLAEKGLKASEGILSFVVRDTAEATTEAVNVFVDLIEEQREEIKADFEKRLGGKVPLDGTGATLSRGAQMAKEANNQTKQPANDPWSTK